MRPVTVAVDQVKVLKSSEDESAILFELPPTRYFVRMEGGKIQRIVVYVDAKVALPFTRFHVDPLSLE